MEVVDMTKIRTPLRGDVVTLHGKRNVGGSKDLWEVLDVRAGPPFKDETMDEDYEVMLRSVRADHTAKLPDPCYSYATSRLGCKWEAAPWMNAAQIRELVWSGDVEENDESVRVHYEDDGRGTRYYWEQDPKPSDRV